MTNVVKQKRSTTAGAIPTTAQIAVGELAINLPDRKIFTSDGTSVFELGSTTPPAGANTNVQFNDSGSFGGTADLTFDKTTKDLAVTNNITSANIITGNVDASAVVTATRLVSNIATGTAPITVTSTTRVANLNVSYSNVTDFSVVGAETAGTFYPTLISGATSANYALGVNNAVSFNAATGAWDATLLGGTLTTAAQPNVTSLGTLTTLTVTGNVDAGNLTTGGQVVATGNVVGSNLKTAGQVISTIATGTAPIVVDSTTRVANLNVTHANVSDFTAIADTGAGNLFLALSVSATANVALKSNNALYFDTPNSTLYSTKFSGTLVAPGSDTQLLFNDGGVISGDSGLTYVKGTDALTAVGTITGGSFTTAGTVSATGNTSGGNITTGGQVVATGNVVGSNLKTAGQVISTLAAGTAPIVVDSTTRVANLNVSYSNVTDFSVVGEQTAGTFYPALVNGATTANYAMGVNNAVSFNAATGAWNATLLGGTLTTAAQPNITSVGTLTSVTVTGTATAGDFSTAGNVVAAGNIQADTKLISNSLVTRTGPLSLEATGASNIELKTGTGNIYLSTQTYITNVKDPSDPQDAATKFYVDAVAQGLKPKAAVQACAGTNINLANAPATIDGVTPSNGDRILVRGQTTTSENGIYSYNGSGSAMTRTSDADTAAELPDGTFVFVEAGTNYGATGHVLTSVIVTLGTDPVIFTQFAAAASYIAGVGLTLTGVTFDLDDTLVTTGSYGNATHSASFNVDQQGRLTAASDVAITANAETLLGTTLKSTVVTSSLTSVGTLGSLTVTGTTTSGNVAVTGNVTAPQLISNIATGTAPLTVTSTTLVPNLYVAKSVAADVGMTANITERTTGNFYLNFGSATSGNLGLGANGAFIANTDNGILYATRFSGELVAPGSDTQVIFNDGGILGGDAGLTYVKGTDTVSVGNINIADNGTAKLMTMKPTANAAIVLYGHDTAGSFGAAERVIIDCGTF